MKRGAWVALVLASILCCGCFLFASGGGLQWSAVRDSADRELWKQCIEQRDCDNLAQDEEYGTLAQSLGYYLRDAVQAPRPQPELIDLLIKQGANPNDTGSGWSLAVALLQPQEGEQGAPAKPAGAKAGAAATARDEATLVKVLEVLVKGGLDLSTPFSSGLESPLYLAMQRNLPKVGRFLLDHGVRVHSDSSQEQPIDLIVQIRSLELLNTLLEKGARLDGWLFRNLFHGGKSRWPEAWPVLCERVDPSTQVSTLGGTPLGVVVSAEPKGEREGLVKCAERLIERGADVNANALGNQEATCLGMCLDNGLCLDSLELLKRFLAQGVEPYCGVGRRTPCLHIPIWRDNEQALSLLLNAGLSVDQRDERGMTALHLAVMENHPNMASMLLAKNANPQIQNNEGKNALELAVAYQRKDITAMIAKVMKSKEAQAAWAAAEEARQKAEVARVLAGTKADPAPGAGGGAAGGGEGVDDWVPPGPRRERPAKLPVVAVFDVELKGISMGKDTQANLSDLLAIRMVETGYFQVVPREDLKKRLTDAKVGSYKPCFDQSCQIELSRELAAEQTLSAKVMKLGTECTSTLTLYDLKRATGVGAASATSRCSEAEVIKTLKKLVDRLTY